MWKLIKIPTYLLEVGLALAILFAVYTRFDEHLYIHTNDYSLKKAEIEKLREGDIILRAGFGFVSERILAHLKERYPVSHCGILDSTKRGWRVIHTVSSQLSGIDGMQADPLARFVRHSRSGSIIVVRAKTGNKEKGKIAPAACRYLSAAAPFDHSFDPFDQNELYCSELIWLILRQQTGIDIYARARTRLDYLPLACFTDTSMFHVVINHHLR